MKNKTENGMRMKNIIFGKYDFINVCKFRLASIAVKRFAKRLGTASSITTMLPTAVLAFITIFFVLCGVNGAFAGEQVSNSTQEQTTRVKDVWVGNVTTTGWKDLGNGWEEMQVETGIKQPVCISDEDAETNGWEWCKPPNSTESIHRIYWNRYSENRMNIFVGSYDASYKLFELDISTKQIKETWFFPSRERPLPLCKYPSPDGRYCLGMIGRKVEIKQPFCSSFWNDECLESSNVEYLPQNNTIMQSLPVFTIAGCVNPFFSPNLNYRYVFWSSDSSRVYFLSDDGAVFILDVSTMNVTKRVIPLRYIRTASRIGNYIYVITFTRDIPDFRNNLESDLYRIDFLQAVDKISKAISDGKQIFHITDESWFSIDDGSLGNNGFAYVSGNGSLYFVDYQTTTKQLVKHFGGNNQCETKAELGGPYFFEPQISLQGVIALFESCNPTTVKLYREKQSNKN